MELWIKEYRKYCRALFLALLLMLATNAVYFTCHAQQIFSINSGMDPPFFNEEGTGFGDVLTKEIFKRLGILIKISKLPAARSLINLNRGIDDATIIRVEGIVRDFPNLRKVPEPLITLSGHAFITDPEIKVTDWNGLKPYNVAFVNGWQIFENNVTEAKSITRVRNGDLLFKLLISERVDIIIFERWMGLYQIKSKKLDKIIVLEPPLARQETFMYVNKKNEALIAEISKSLKAIKQDGTYDKIYDQTLKVWELSQLPAGRTMVARH